MLLSNYMSGAVHSSRNLTAHFDLAELVLSLLIVQVYPMYSLLHYFCTHRLEQCFLLCHIYFSTHSCCWYPRQGLKSQDITQISKALCSRPPTRELQYVSILDYDARHTVAEPCTLLRTIVHLQREHCRHMEHGQLVDNSSCYISQCALGNGYSALGICHSCCYMGFNCCNVWLHGGA